MIGNVNAQLDDDRFQVQRVKVLRCRLRIPRGTVMKAAASYRNSLHETIDNRVSIQCGWLFL